MDVKFEYLGEDREFPGSKTWRVEAIHVTTTRNKRKFTLRELKESGRSLSFRRLNINHAQNRQMPEPQNLTLGMRFDESKMAVVGNIRVSDPAVNAMIETDRIKQVSIEQIPTGGESCNDISCEQHGVAFIGLALLESHVLPGDPNAGIIKNESTISNHYETLTELLVSNTQRTCRECTDEVMCELCAHKEQDDACVSKWIKKLSDEDKSIPRDQIIAMAFSKCRKGEGATQQEAWEFYKIAREAWDRDVLGKKTNFEKNVYETADTIDVLVKN